LSQLTLQIVATIKPALKSMVVGAPQIIDDHGWVKSLSVDRNTKWYAVSTWWGGLYHNMGEKINFIEHFAFGIPHWSFFTGPFYKRVLWNSFSDKKM
jgi:hypothetical protein